MDIDWEAVRERFRAMSREELLAEAAFELEGYAPRARGFLEEELRSRGLTAADIEARRSGEASGGAPAAAMDLPALLVSSVEKDGVVRLASALRAEGIPAVVREVESRGCRGPAIGRWGLFVPGLRAEEAGRALERLLPAGEAAACEARGCGDPPCARGSSEAPDYGYPEGEEAWPEDGDWWKTGGEEEREGGEG